MKAVLWTTALVLVAGAAQAERFSAVNGTKLLEMCTARDTTDCTSYIEGVSDAASFYQRLRPANGSKGPKLDAYICAPNEVTGTQMRETVVAWAKAHPDRMTLQASGIVLRALNDAYKCR